MKCETAREYFSDLVEGSVEQALRLAIELHFKVCPACREEYKGFGYAWNLLEGIPLVEPPETLHPKIMAALADSQRPEPVTVVPVWKSWWRQLQQPVHPRMQRGWSYGFAAAAVLLIAITGLVFNSGSRDIVWWPYPVRITQTDAATRALSAVQVRPLMKDGSWVVGLSGTSEPVRVQSYFRESGHTGSDWAPWMISSDYPTRGLKQVKSQILHNNMQLGPFTVAPERGVSTLVLDLSVAGRHRYVAVFLPKDTTLPIERAASQGQDILSAALWSVARDFQVAVVSEATVDKTVELSGSLMAFETLDQIASQVDMTVEPLGADSYRVSPK